MRRREDASFMPVCFDVSACRVVVIGGGRVAVHKLRTIRMYARNLTVIAPEVDAWVARARLAVIKDRYRPGYLRGAGLVYACTNDSAVNRKIADDCRRLRIPVNVADDPALSDFVSPAVYRRGIMSIAVSSNGSAPARSVAWRNRIKELARHGHLAGKRSHLPIA